LLIAVGLIVAAISSKLTIINYPKGVGRIGSALSFRAALLFWACGGTAKAVRSDGDDEYRAWRGSGVWGAILQNLDRFRQP
jgi:hypothetical protein